MEEMQVTRMPSIGDKVPSFQAVTVQGEIHLPEDYTRERMILSSHPADFIPVRTTEFTTFASMAGEFRSLNIELVGLSADPLYAHTAWPRKIQELEWSGMKNVEIKFPLIEDIRTEAASKYGIIQPGQFSMRTVRAAFIIDPQAKTRTILHYPLSIGRSPDEIKRTTPVLQRADQDSVATPANWRSGDDVIVSMAGSCGTVRERMESQNEDQYCLDWLTCFRRGNK